ncbi:MAG: 50S ribosome-binding GTPase [Deltaproteobacteria bacterium]|nr:50S ribosome-binding GTPase [Deltaproteobacteria bacterium]
MSCSEWFPGITVSKETFCRKYDLFWSVVDLKRLKESTAVRWIVFVGGTGTGKSTLFNFLCKSNVSSTGVERPKTGGCIVALPERAAVDDSFYHLAKWGQSYPADGTPEYFTLAHHTNEKFENWALVDTPDLDSLIESHHRLAEKMGYLADVVIFVLSEEKYADEKLVSVLIQQFSWHPCIVITVNKVTDSKIIAADVEEILRGHGFPDFRTKVITVPFFSIVPDNWCEFEDAILKRLPFCLQNEARLTARFKGLCSELLTILAKEREVLASLEVAITEAMKKSFSAFVEKHTKDISESARSLLREEIQRLYSRYDIFSGPRRFLKDLFFAPFRWIKKSNAKSKEAALVSDAKYLQHQLIMSAVMGSINQYIVDVYRIMEPYDSSSLCKRMKDEKLILSESEVEEKIRNLTERLMDWLRGEFEKLSKGIPKLKEWGIYSSMLLWAVFLLAIESALGGGISVFDALLDSVLAPVVSKYTVEWFAKRDIHRIGQEFIDRYKQGILEIMESQRMKFVELLKVEDLVKMEMKRISSVCEET